MGKVCWFVQRVDPHHAPSQLTGEHRIAGNVVSQVRGVSRTCPPAAAAAGTRHALDQLLILGFKALPVGPLHLLDPVLEGGHVLGRERKYTPPTHKNGRTRWNGTAETVATPDHH